jgi:hypothetical protein
VLQILDSRWLSRVRAIFFLGTTGTAAVLIVVGLALAALKALAGLGTLPLAFIGLGLLITLGNGAAWLRARVAPGSAGPTVAQQSQTATLERVVHRAAGGPLEAKFETQDRRDREIDVGQRVQWLRFVRPVERSVRPIDLPAAIRLGRWPWSRARIVVQRLTDKGFLIDEIHTGVREISVEVHTSEVRSAGALEQEVPWREDPAEVADGLARVKLGVEQLIAERALDRAQVRSELLPAFDRDTTARYYIRLRDDALALFDRAHALGVVALSERAKLENPGDLNQVSMLPHVLGTLEKRLRGLDGGAANG